MTHGPESLRSGEWQPVPGWEDASIFPYIRKIDTISSNTYILDLPGHLIIIDPGGLPEQGDLILHHFEDVAGDRPAIILLTHVHIDHCLEALWNPVLRKRCVFAAHRTGADALESRDDRITLAGLFRQEIREVAVGMRLFAEDRRQAGDVVFRRKDVAIPGDGILGREDIEMDGSGTIEIFHAPGHSPDSILIKAGTLLFTGDLLFAANPGIAGAYGWSQPDLMSSVQKTIWLLEHEDITICCPGHGRTLPAAQALAVLRRTGKEASTLTGIREMNPQSARETAVYAENLMTQVQELFTIISGRLFLVSHILDELEESGESERLRELAGADEIDRLIEEFAKFSEEYRAGRKVDVHLLLKAGQIVSKLDDLFSRDKLGMIIDPSLVRRAGRLLTDYMTIFRGFRNEPEMQALDLTAVVMDRIRGIRTNPFSEEDLLELSDDEVAYKRALVARLAFVPLLDGIAVAFHATGEIPEVITSAERFPDLIQAVLEEIAGNGPESLEIEIRQRDNLVILSVSGEGISHGVPAAKERFLVDECLNCGGLLSFSQEGNRQTFLFTFPVAGEVKEPSLRL